MTYRHPWNPPICYGSEWENFVDDEANSRGIDPKDWQALEDLEDELRTKCEDQFEAYQIEAYEQSNL